MERSMAENCRLKRLARHKPLRQGIVGKKKSCLLWHGWKDPRQPSDWMVSYQKKKR